MRGSGSHIVNNERSLLDADSCGLQRLCGRQEDVKVVVETGEVNSIQAFLIMIMHHGLTVVLKILGNREHLKSRIEFVLKIRSRT